MSKPLYRFAFLCPKTWQELPADSKHADRFCDHCQRSVYLAESAPALARLVGENRCVAVGPDLAKRCITDITLGDVQPVPKANEQCLVKKLELPKGDYSFPEMMGRVVLVDEEPEPTKDEKLKKLAEEDARENE